MSNTTLTDYIAASTAFPRCLPGLPGTEVALLRIFSLEQLTTAVEAGSQCNSIEELARTECSLQQNQLLEAFRQRLSPGQGWAYCNLALLEKRAAAIPDAFSTHCDGLRKCFAAFPAQQIRNLVAFRSSVPETLDQLAPALLDLILAPVSAPHSLAYFRSCAHQLGVDIQESDEQLLAEVQTRAGPLKDSYPLLVGSAGSGSASDINPTLKGFVSDELGLSLALQPNELYKVLEFLFLEDFPNPVEFKVGLYNYLTASSARFNNAAPLPQQLLNTMLHSMVASLGRLLMATSVGFSFLNQFTSSEQPKQLLEKLYELSSSLNRLAEFTAIPYQPVFHRLIELHKTPQAWSYQSCTRPWEQKDSYLPKRMGPFGTVVSGDLAWQLSDSDYQLCFKWTNTTPDRNKTMAELQTESPLLARLVDSLGSQERNPLLEKLLYSANVLLAAPAVVDANVLESTDEFSI